MSSNKVGIIGAGPAGLTAAWELEKRNIHSDIYESDTQVGGISKTVVESGWRFDLGGHRFFTKVDKVNQLWDEMLHDEEFMMRPRKSRIFYKGKFFDYPLQPLNALRNLGLWETARCMFSLLTTKIFPPKDQSNFENWVAARFGWRLYRIFFKTYTEKVWGIKATEIQSDWAAQRIKDLSLIGAIKDAFNIGGKNRVITSLIDSFKYPRLGPGQLWESAATQLEKQGSTIFLNTSLQKVSVNPDGTYQFHTSSNQTTSHRSVMSSLPLSIVPGLLNAPKQIVELANKLKYRDFLIVALPVKDEGIFDDNWIYIHDPKVQVGRIQNYGSWSPEMVKDGSTCLGMEYFVNQGDKMWNMADEQLVRLAREELATIGFKVESILENEGFVVRVPRAYPVYDENYRESVEGIRKWLFENHPNWYQIGRNGQHRYNNQDHSMMTAVEAVNVLGAEPSDHYWDVNVDEEYHEEKEASKTGRDAPIFRSTTSN
jgi:protoporphyrinogen oxidase